MGKMVNGVGLNDAPYQVTRREKVDGKWKQIWMCPFYRKWKDMLKRCYSDKFQASRPTYKGCRVADEWLIFTNFKSWMEAKDWEGKHLDKDILGDGKLYSESNCLLLSSKVNTFVEWSTGSRELPIGVSWCEDKGTYRSFGSCSGKTIYLGHSKSILGCQRFWIRYKIEVCDDMLRECMLEDDIIGLKHYKGRLEDSLNLNSVFNP